MCQIELRVTVVVNSSSLSLVSFSEVATTEIIFGRNSDTDQEEKSIVVFSTHNTRWGNIISDDPEILRKNWQVNRVSIYGVPCDDLTYLCGVK